MSANQPATFHDLLAQGIDGGGFQADDVLAIVLPLMARVIDLHTDDLVAPLSRLEGVRVGEDCCLSVDAAGATAPRVNTTGIESIQKPPSAALDVTGHEDRVADVTMASLTATGTDVAAAGQEITRPVYLAGYDNWEEVSGHHDEITDIFSLGMILASLACSLDFRDEDDLRLFAGNRGNLFALNSRLNPVIASVIVEMTELNRHRRAQDLPAIYTRLENYRDQAEDFDAAFASTKEFLESPAEGRRRIVLGHLRNRLFDVSRRNRLVYFKPTLQSLNLTVASVPLMLDYRNIRPAQLFLWNDAIASAVAKESAIPLGKYLRFEDAPYIPGVLDRIIGEARRDRAEYGFAQLHLVLVFLRWHNLKDAPGERIDSPLVLLPVELARRKGVRDSYVLTPTTSVAEINPTLRHHLGMLYGLELPETIDLETETFDGLHAALAARIRASEPGVTLRKLDRPQIRLIHEQARQRLSQYQRRLKLRARPAQERSLHDYSYSHGDYRPLGIQLFLAKVRPAPLPLAMAAGAAPKPRMPAAAPDAVPPETKPPQEEILETAREMYTLQDGAGAEQNNPYLWDFDLCSMTLANLNYRKMTLMRDYASLIEDGIECPAFDAIFDLAPRPAEEEQPQPMELAAQHPVVACDASQAAAVARARTGQSCIIQGPPGTGKSQTITNLIADYVARGRRVLFVCEKRAAIDVVYHRLRQQGLDELCCLIHDSQTDKKAYVQNLKQTYETFLAAPAGPDSAADARHVLVAKMERELEALGRFSSSMTAVNEAAGVTLRELLGRLARLGRPAADLSPEQEEALPHYRHWLGHGALVARIAAALADIGAQPCLARHPLRMLGPGVVHAEQPLQTFTDMAGQTEAAAAAVENRLELSGLPSPLWESFAGLQAAVDFALLIAPLAAYDIMGVLDPRSEASAAFARITAQMDRLDEALRRATERNSHWRARLAPEDTATALELARSLQGSLLRFVKPSYWRLRRVLNASYDFAAHAVAPSWESVLSNLSAEHAARDACAALREMARTEHGIADLDAVRAGVESLRSGAGARHPAIKALLPHLVDAGGAELAKELAALQQPFGTLRGLAAGLLTGVEEMTFETMHAAIDSLREDAQALPELLPLLAELDRAPAELARAVRTMELDPRELEHAIAIKTLRHAYRTDKTLNRFDATQLDRHIARLDKFHRQWLDQNSRTVRNMVSGRFRERARISSLPASQLQPDQKAFKKAYAAGRRELEHEFAKTMRYRAIRDLAAGNTGMVVQDLKPVWLMSPLSISDTLPLDPGLFDVVIFDEASQIPLEEAVPAIYRGKQAIVVGDEMQLPPTSFFTRGGNDEDPLVFDDEGERIEVDLDADSFLNQASRRLPSAMLAWHYRSRYEALIAYSNAAFYKGGLFTIPDRCLPGGALAEIRVCGASDAAMHTDALLERSISFHFMEDGVYADRRNPAEATHIARLVRELLRRQTGLSLGIVAFSEAQQGEIEDALQGLAEEDREFAAALEAEYTREEDDQFCGLIVKNLENIQGDERDIVILSICYGHNARGKMLMNFGPINQRGGEKRLNVIFSRAKQHMAVVTSIRHGDITNDYNDGAAALKRFLQYAEAVSRGETAGARAVLDAMNAPPGQSRRTTDGRDAVVEDIAARLRARGHTVDLDVGQSRFCVDIAVRGRDDGHYSLGIVVDTPRHYANPNLLERYHGRPGILRAFGWRVAMVLAKDWQRDPDAVAARLERLALQNDGAAAAEPANDCGTEGSEPPAETLESPALEPPADGHAVPDQPASASVADAEAREIRRFEFVRGTSRKFWEVELSGATLTVHFGRIGTAGQSQAKTFADPDRARRERDRLVAEKTGKGYVEVAVGHSHRP